MREQKIQRSKVEDIQQPSKRIFIGYKRHISCVFCRLRVKRVNMNIEMILVNKNIEIILRSLIVSRIYQFDWMKFLPRMIDKETTLISKFSGRRIE